MVYNCCAHCSVYMKILWQLNWTCLNSVQWFCWEITFVQKMFNGKSTHEMILMPYEICLLWDKLKKTITDLNSCLNCIGFGWNSPKRFILFEEKTLRKRENTNYCAAVEMFLLLVICHQDCIKFNSFVKMMALGRCYGFVSRIWFKFRHLGQFNGWKRFHFTNDGNAIDEIRCASISFHIH